MVQTKLVSIQKIQRMVLLVSKTFPKTWNKGSLIQKNEHCYIFFTLKPLLVFTDSTNDKQLLILKQWNHLWYTCTFTRVFSMLSLSRKHFYIPLLVILKYPFYLLDIRWIQLRFWSLICQCKVAFKFKVYMFYHRLLKFHIHYEI